jgi:uncharacterized protein YndB with AHSA1/START domain
VIEREIPYPPGKNWRAVTEGPLIKEWLMDNDFQPVVGHSFSFRSTPVSNWNGVIDSAVLVVEPNKKFSYSWGTMGWKASSFGRWARRATERLCAWNILSSVPIKMPPIRARITAGKGSSATWNELSRGCNKRRHRKEAVMNQRHHTVDSSLDSHHRRNPDIWLYL